MNFPRLRVCFSLTRVLWRSATLSTDFHLFCMEEMAIRLVTPTCLSFMCTVVVLLWDSDWFLSGECPLDRLNTF